MAILAVELVVDGARCELFAHSMDFDGRGGEGGWNKSVADASVPSVRRTAAIDSEYKRETACDAAMESTHECADCDCVVGTNG